MKKFCLLIAVVWWISSFQAPEEWGFFAHRRINRLAVFTLPPEMILFFKPHIEYLTEHAVDPDKRRYATRHEAPRHYIDIDHWGSYPFPGLPRRWTDALLLHTDVYLVRSPGDSLHLFGAHCFTVENGEVGWKDTLAFPGLTMETYRDFYRRQWLPQYYEESWSIPCDSLALLWEGAQTCTGVFAYDRFSSYGILPYHLLAMQHRLTEAFRQGNAARILRLAADMGHYLGDAHVPLHTTENYNGQLTGQEGIHAFWESRIPELFADAEYDFFVGKAEYIEQPRAYFWKVVLESHRLVDQVLRAEQQLRDSFPSDEQFCFDLRLGATVRTQCRAFAQAYREAMGGMVERRMRAAIRAIGSAWYTAWVDAGQPDLSALTGGALSPEEAAAIEALEKSFRSGEVKGRNHRE